MSNQSGNFRRLVRNLQQISNDPARKAANRLRDQLDRKQYIAYRDVGLVVNAYLAIVNQMTQNEAKPIQCDCALCQADRKYKEQIRQAVKQAIDQGLGRMDDTE